MIHPQLRPGLELARDGVHLVLHDKRRIGGPPLVVSPADVAAANQFTGRTPLADVRAGLTIPELEALVAKLDAALFLNSPHFAAYLAGLERRPLLCYPAEPDALRAALHDLFAESGLPGAARAPARAILLPHMDYGRGNVTYGHGFRELAERTRASLFVVVATSHYSSERFTLTRKNYATPLGVVPTDVPYLERLEAAYGPGLYADPYAHLPEHSIEIEVAGLQFLFPHRPFRIVPLLVGSFGDCVRSRRSPSASEDIARMVRALQVAEAAAGEDVCYVISGDLAHIGPKFRQPGPLTSEQLAASRAQDERLLTCLETADAEGYFEVIAAEGDARNICGLPPTWLTLAATQPRAGRVLHYQQYAHPTGHESVSFAAAAFA